jgi:hypothetical protein
MTLSDGSLICLAGSALLQAIVPKMIKREAASQPTASVFMESTAMDTFSVRPHVAEDRFKAVPQARRQS